MTFNNIIFGLIILPIFAYSAEEAEIQIYIITPNINEVKIGSYFTPNHQSYPLQPSVIKHNYTYYPIFSNTEALKILDNGKQAVTIIQTNSFLAIPITINRQTATTPLYFSISEKNQTHFSLLPTRKNQKVMPIKIYLIDVSKAEITNPILEITPNKIYSMRKAKNKSLFIFIPNNDKSSKKVINLNNYALPLEVHYHSP